MSSLVECTEVVSTRKIRIFPTSDQKRAFKEWLGASRNAYNYTVNLANQHSKDNYETLVALQAAGLTEVEARDYLKSNCTFPHWMAIKKKDNLDLWSSRESWLKDIPKKCFTEAIGEAWNARKINITKGQKFDLSFRSRKDPKQSCFIPNSAFKNGSIFTLNMRKWTGKGSETIRFSEPLPETLKDARLVLENDRWFITMPELKTITQRESQARVVALDPGVRSFMTFYGEDSCGHLGKSDIGRIQRLCTHLDALMSKIATAKAKQRYRLKKAANKLRWKIKDLVKEMHYKVASWLVDNFDIILLPTFETSEMTLKRGRRLNKKSVRQMLTWSHYQFSQILELKAKERIGTIICTRTGEMIDPVIRVCEAYTSKTVSWTGELKQNLGGAKFIRSGSIVVDRDINGARGIFLRALVDCPFLVDCLEDNFRDAMVNES